MSNFDVCVCVYFFCLFFFFFGGGGGGGGVDEGREDPNSTISVPSLACQQKCVSLVCQCWLNW